MTRTAVIEGRVQIGIMLLMGGGAGAASFKHIHDLAVHYGQPSWIGWANATVVELMSIVSGLEIRRRKRAQPKQSTGFVYLVFFGAVLISLAANVAKAHPSPWGWIMAALPALGFLAVVKIVLTRQPIETGPDRSGTDNPRSVQSAVRTPDLDARMPPDPSTLRTGPDRTTAARDTDPVGASDQLTALDVRTQRAMQSEQSTTSPAESMETDAIDDPDQTDNRESDRSTGYSLVPAQRINGHDTGIPDLEPSGDERSQSRPEPHRTPSGPVGDRSADVGSGPVGDRSADDVSGPVRGQSASDTFRPPRTESDYELLEQGRTIAARAAMRKVRLTRQVLIDEIRGDGGTISTDRASDLLRWLKEDKAAPVGTG